MKKTLLSIALILLLVAFLCACGSTAPASQSPTETPATVATPTPSATPAPTPAVTSDNAAIGAVKADFIARADEIDAEADAMAADANATQTVLTQSVYSVYIMWDELLNDVYNYLKESLPAEQFAALQEDEIKWIDEKENGMDEAAREWAGGSGEKMIYFSAGIQYTRERVLYLISLIK